MPCSLLPLLSLTLPDVFSVQSALRIFKFFQALEATERSNTHRQALARQCWSKRTRTELAEQPGPGQCAQLFISIAREAVRSTVVAAFRAWSSRYSAEPRVCVLPHASAIQLQLYSSTRQHVDLSQPYTMAGNVRQPIDVASLERYITANVPDIALPIDVKQVR